jgi:hypothetical protein
LTKHRNKVSRLIPNRHKFALGWFNFHRNTVRKTRVLSPKTEWPTNQFESHSNSLFKLCLPIHINYTRTIRVTRLGEFSPIGRLFSLELFWKIQK